MTLLWLTGKNIQQRYSVPDYRRALPHSANLVGRLAMKRRGLYPTRCQCHPAWNASSLPDLFCDEVWWLKKINSLASRRLKSMSSIRYQLQLNQAYSSSLIVEDIFSASHAKTEATFSNSLPVSLRIKYDDRHRVPICCCSRLRLPSPLVYACGFTPRLRCWFRVMKVSLGALKRRLSCL